MPVTATAEDLPASPVLSEIIAGQGLSLTQAARRFPSARMGRPVHSSCIWRWMHSGVRLRDGRVVKLECARVAGRWLTSEPALARFIAAQTPATDNSPTPAPRTPTARQRASERAAKQLDAIGI
jgi:hypothetical protein